MTRVEIKQETQKDQMLQKVIQFLRWSWPSDLTGELQQFQRRRDSLAIIDECLMFGDRVVIPTKLGRAVLKQLHSGHPGINRKKAIAGSIVYWPNIDSDIEKTIKSCVPCMEAQKNPPRIMDSHWTYPVHVDFAGPINGQSFLIVVDAHSKWPVIFPMKKYGRPLNNLFSLNGYSANMACQKHLRPTTEHNLHRSCSGTFENQIASHMFEHLLITLNPMVKSNRL